MKSIRWHTIAFRGLTVPRRKVFIKIAVAFVLGGCPAVFASTITVSVFPSSQAVTLGSLVNVALEVAGLGAQAAPSLGTFDLNLDFDPTILSFNSTVFGDPILGDQLDPTGLGNTINFSSPGSGTVELFDLSLDTASQLNGLQPAAFILGSLAFDTIGAGTSPLNVTINAMGDADGNSLSAGIQDGSLGVNSAPEPRPVLLVAVAVIVIVISTRRSYYHRHSS
jgi:hypothetical protein